MSIDKLAICSKILYDKRLLEQRQEIEALKLRVFWLENGEGRMREAMNTFNLNITKCGCLACTVSGRCDDENDFHGSGTSNCYFKKPFEDLMRIHHLTITENPGDLFQRGNMKWTSGDAHFINAAGQDWTSWWAFGEKLWKANSVDDLDNYIAFLNACLST